MPISHLLYNRIQNLHTVGQAVELRCSHFWVLVSVSSISSNISPTADQCVRSTFVKTVNYRNGVNSRPPSFSSSISTCMEIKGKELCKTLSLICE